jgi:hypothetical protein
VPDAVPETFRSPAQVALNEPFAVVAVCSVAFHLKSTHVDMVGIPLAAAEADAHVPIRAATPVPLGLVVVLVCSKLVQPATATETATAQARMYFFMAVFLQFQERPGVAGELDHTTRTPSR